MRRIFFVCCFILIQFSVFAQINTPPRPTLMPKNSFGLDDELKRRFSAQLKQRMYHDVNVGIIVKRVYGPTLYEKNPDQLFIPASTVKIITGLSALIKFDAHYRFYTLIRHDGTLDQHTINGNLYIIGYGDPMLSDKRLRQTVIHLRDKGIHHVTGDIIYVSNYFDSDHSTRYPDAAHYYTTSSALSINYNQIKLKLVTGNSLETHPKTSYATLTQDVQYQQRDDISGRPSLTYTKNDQGDDYHISGNLTDGDFLNKNTIMAVTRPGLYAATRFKELLLEEGISVNGTIKKGFLPRRTQYLNKILSPHLHQILPVMQLQSNNMIAETLNKNLGASYVSEPGTRDKGLSIIKSLCETRFKFKKEGYHLVDPSGLSYKNQITPRQMVNVLDSGYKNPYIQEAFIASLPKLGQHIELEQFEVPEHMDIFLKTGTLSKRGVNTVAGYVMDKVSSDIYTFVIFTNRKTPGKLTLSGTLTSPLLKTIIESIKS